MHRDDDLLAKANGAKAAQARLSDFTINEVSLVDLAANKRTFLILKREEGALAKSASKAQAAAALLKHGADLRPAERVVLAKMARGAL
jgi:hypothetical protein